MSPRDTSQRFFVSPSSFDNIGAVLNGMGQGFAHDVVGWGELKTWHSADAKDVLFLNCALRYGFGYGKRVARMVREFVELGGTLYVSDWALAAVKEAFPRMLDFDGGGAKGSSHCSVVDRGLQEMIGERIEVEFDMVGCEVWQFTSHRANKDPIRHPGSRPAPQRHGPVE